MCRHDMITTRHEFTAVVEEVLNNLGALKPLYVILCDTENYDDYGDVSWSLHIGTLHAIDNIAASFSFAYKHKLDKPDKWYTISTRHSFRWALKFGYISKEECMKWLNYCSNANIHDLDINSLKCSPADLDFSFISDFVEDAKDLCETIITIENRGHERSSK